jgi:hypothetical protein
MDKVHVKSIREVINHIGLKDRHAQKLVINNIYNNKWKQETPNSAIIIPNEETIESVFKRFLIKHKVAIINVDSNGLTEEASRLFESIR